LYLFPHSETAGGVGGEGVEEEEKGEVGGSLFFVLFCFVFCCCFGEWRVCVFPSPPDPLLADGAVLLSAFGAGGARDGLHGRRQRAEEARDQREAQAAPRAEHGPAVAVADVVGQAVEVARVAGQLEVDARHAGAQRDDAEGACGGRRESSRVSRESCMTHTC